MINSDLTNFLDPAHGLIFHNPIQELIIIRNHHRDYVIHISKTYFNEKVVTIMDTMMKYRCVLMNSRYTCNTHPVIDSTFSKNIFFVRNKFNLKIFFHERFFVNF